MVKITRRNAIKAAGGASIVSMAGCTGGGGSNESTPTPSDGGSTSSDGDSGTPTPTQGPTLQAYLPGGTIYETFGETAKESGAWADHNVDVKTNYVQFGALVNSLPSGEIDSGDYPLLSGIPKINGGADWVIWGFSGGLMGFNGMYVRADSDIHSIEDLEGKRLGVWSWGAGTVQLFRALTAEQTGLDLRQDFETTVAAPPALKGLLDKGDLDAVIEISSLTIAMEARPDQYRRIGQPNAMWLDETGYPLISVVWMATRDWYEQNTEYAKRLVAANNDVVDYWRGDTMAHLQKYGPPGNIDDQVEMDVVNNWANQGLCFAGEDLQNNAEFVDSMWDFMGLMEKHGFFESVPEKSDILVPPMPV